MDMRFRFFALVFPLMAAASAPALAVPALDFTAPALVAAAQDNLSLAATTNGAAAQTMIEKLGARAMDAITDESMAQDAKKKLFRQILSQNFDMDTIGRFAMGRYWRQATPAQQQEYLRLYEQMVIDVYTSRFDRYSGQKFNVTGNRVDESGDAVVTSEVTGSGTPVRVDWRVRNKGNGPRVIDVMVEGVSMAVTQRNDFAGVIQQGGGTVDALIAYLKKGGTSDVEK